MNTRVVTLLIAKVAAVAGVVVLVSTAAFAAPARPAPVRWYHVTALGIAGYPSDINDHGDVVGHAETPDGQHPFLWRHGTMTDLGGLPLSDGSGEATDINNRGQVVGYSNIYSKVPRMDRAAFIWQNGVMTALRTPGFDSVAAAINDRGQVVGAYQTETGSHAFLWDRDVLVDLGPGTASDINDRGQVAGSRPTVAGSSVACIWYRGRVTDLDPGAASGIWVAGVNGRGWVTGAGWVDGEGYAYVWRSGTMTNLGHLGVGFTYPVDINGRGQIVGMTNLNNANYAIPFLWQDGVMVDLTEHGVPVHGTVAGFNDRGQLVGAVYDPETPGPSEVVIYS